MNIACYSWRMFSQITTMFYMLSALMAFFMGSSKDANLYVIAVVPAGFVLGYLFDRFSNVKQLWYEDQPSLYMLVATRYVAFSLLTGVFFFAGTLFANWL